MSRKFTRTFQLLALLTCLLVAAAVFAQSTVDGAIGGTVFDAQKAAVPNATITVHNNGTNADVKMMTDASGNYRALKLQPGVYTVTIEAAGFKKEVRQNVIVEVGRITSIDPQLVVGGSQEAVSVTSEAPTVNTESQDFATNVNQVAINNLPINGRRWSAFALLTPGATPDGDFGLVSFRGISGLQNNATVDGGDNNQAFFAEERGRTRAAYTVSQSSVREFQVNSSNYSSEYGRSAGGVVNSVTKSGTNSMHGELFYFIRDNTLGATNPRTTAPVKQADGTFAVVPIKPDDRRQQFGGNLGGALIKDKLFYFFNYDQQKKNFPGVAGPGVPGTFFAGPTAAELSTLKGRMAAGTTDAQAAAAFASGLDVLAGVTGTVPRKGDESVIFPKLDWVVNSKNTASFSFNRMRWNSPAGVQTGPYITRGIASFGDDGVKVDSLTTRLNTVLSNTVTNELRFNWGRDFEFQTSNPPSTTEQALLQKATRFGPNGRMPSVAVGGSSGITFGKPNFLERAAFPDEHRIQVADNVVNVHGKHTFKVGADINRVNDLNKNLFSEAGVYTYNARGDFIADLVNPAGKFWGNYTQGFGPSGFEFNSWDFNGYLQDDFKLLPRLTINAGLRYEYEMLPQPQIGNPTLDASCAMVGLQMGFLGITDCKDPRVASLNRAGSFRFPKDHNNFGPRFGFAWDPFGNGKTAVRGGYGIYYGRIINSTISNAITNTGVANGQNTVTATKTNGPTFPNVMVNPATATTGSVAGASAVVFAPNAQTPQIHQADLVLEREITKNTYISASYLLSMGRELVNFVDSNLQNPGGCPANPTLAANPNCRVYQITGGPLDGQSFVMPIYTKRLDNAFGTVTNVLTNGNSNYNALVLQFNRRMTNGLQFQTNYTWSHSIDDGQNSTTFTDFNDYLDPFNPGLERGTSRFDIRHRFVASAVYQPQMFANSSTFVKGLLNGWSLAPVVTIQSGRPFTEFISSGNIGIRGLNGSGGASRLPILGRNSFRQPGLQNIDLRLARKFSVHEGQNIEFTAEAFNLFNHLIATTVTNNLYSTTTTTGSNIVKLTQSNADLGFGTITAAGSLTYRERQVQFGARYTF